MLMAEPQTVATDTLVTQLPADDQRIRVRAYELYEKRNGVAGDAESDWYNAEAELRAAPAEAAK
jgi:DUF2934 family protein